LVSGPKTFSLACTPRQYCGLQSICNSFPWLSHVFADDAYAGGKLQDGLAQLGERTVEIVKRSDTANRVPRRGVVERTFALLNCNRRRAKAFQATIASATTWLYVISVKLMFRWLAIAWAFRSPAVRVVIRARL